MLKKITLHVPSFSFFISVLLELFFPHHCYLCKKEGASICEKCLSKIPQAIETPYPYILSAYSFKDPSIKKIIHAIKYFHRKDLIEPLVARLFKQLPITDIVQYKNYILIPIPMPKLREYARGYNHAEAIAYALAELTSQKVRTDILVRNFTKKRQMATTSRKERILNQEKSFGIHKKDLVGMQIILIDDVTTTGATLNEARKILIEHGAISILAITLAH